MKIIQGARYKSTLKASYKAKSNFQDLTSGLSLNHDFFSSVRSIRAFIVFQLYFIYLALCKSAESVDYVNYLMFQVFFMPSIVLRAHGVRDFVLGVLVYEESFRDALRDAVERHDAVERGTDGVLRADAD